MRRAVLLTYLFFALLSAIGAFWLIPRYTPEFSGFGMPPSALPYTLCGIMFLFSLPVLWRAIHSRDNAPNPLTPRRWLHLALFGAVLFATMPILHAVGFIPGAAIVLAVLQVLCGQRHLPTLLGVSLGTACVLWACMTWVLHVPMP